MGAYKKKFDRYRTEVCFQINMMKLNLAPFWATIQKL